MVIGFRSASFAVLLSLGISGAANASTVIEGFDALPGGPNSSWSSQGFTYTPAKGPNGQCFGGQCLQEYDGPDAKDYPDGIVTTITENNPPGDGLFDFLGFYVNFNGLGGNLTDNTNFLKIEGGGKSVFLKVVTSVVGQPFKLFNEDGSAATEADFDSKGYFVAFTGGYFDGVRSITITAQTRGSVRYDCSAVSTGGTELKSDFSDLTSCKADVSVIPLPAAGWLLLAGVGGLVAMRRKKAA